MIMNKVKNFIISHQLIAPGEHILAACSGGPDSLVLVELLRQLRVELGFQLAVAHVDHMFRGIDSAQDAQFVRAYCQQRGLTCFSTEINIPRYLREQGGSSQNISRKLRYEYLRSVAKDWGNAKIATGHHRDDQAETILLHLLRGSGGTGLSGMHARTEQIIRPLLPLTRREVEDYCRQHALEPRQDASNFKPDYLRNRLRLRIIPQLEAAVGTSVREPLCRAGQILADEQDFFNQSVRKLWPVLTGEETPDSVRIYTKPLEELHIALKRLIFRLLIEKKQGSLTGITFQHVETLIDMAGCWPVGSKFDLPGGWRAERQYDAIQVYRRKACSVPPQVAPPGVQLLIPGDTEIRELGVRIRASIQSGPPPHDAATAVFDLASLPQPLFVRSRQPGDKFSPRGMQGEKKLKDFFIDKKIPRSLRDQIPVFVDSRGTIFWLGGIRGSRHGQITEATTEYLALKIIGIQEALL